VEFAAAIASPPRDKWGRPAVGPYHGEDASRLISAAAADPSPNPTRPPPGHPARLLSCLFLLVRQGFCMIQKHGTADRNAASAGDKQHAAEALQMQRAA